MSGIYYPDVRHFLAEGTSTLPVESKEFQHAIGVFLMYALQSGYLSLWGVTDLHLWTAKRKRWAQRRRTEAIDSVFSCIRAALAALDK